MKEMYKDNSGNWHYGNKGEKLSEVSYSTNSVKPVSDSIPIEWIIKYDTNLCHTPYCFEDDDRSDIEKMVDDWRKENDSK